ncbi:TPA: glycosyltransferase family 1 protein, partial [Klebsiella pneumoniae]|nr:glycosyltransferase family 1 protein [Klebsiella pneumoniae]
TDGELYNKLALKGSEHYKKILQSQDKDLSKLLRGIFDAR